MKQLSTSIQIDSFSAITASIEFSGKVSSYLFFSGKVSSHLLFSAITASIEFSGKVSSHLLSLHIDAVDLGEQFDPVQNPIPAVVEISACQQIEAHQKGSSNHATKHV